VLARAYNQRKLHDKARAACLRVIEHYPEEEFDFTAINLIVLTELALAEASLGEFDNARRRIEKLLGRLRLHQNPLTLGHLYETQVEIALITSDAKEARSHFAHMAEQYERVKSSSLVQRCEVLRAAIDELAGDVPIAKLARRMQPATTTGSLSSNVALLADQLQASRGRSFEERAVTALRALAASTQAAHAVLGFVDQEHALQIVATLDGKPVSPDLQAWMLQRVQHELQDPDTIVSGGATTDHAAPGGFRENSLHYSLTLLPQAAAGGPTLLGIAALGGERGAPPTCSRELVRLVCELLAEAPSSTEQN
jgi:tetratricopeptide (TPR) repeat protein